MTPCQATCHAIRKLEAEIESSVAVAKREMADPKTRVIGRLRMDLIEECRRRLFILRCIAKDRESRLLDASLHGTTHAKGWRREIKESRCQFDSRNRLLEYQI